MWTGHYDELGIIATSAGINLGFLDHEGDSPWRIDLKSIEGSNGLDFSVSSTFAANRCRAGTRDIDVSATVFAPGELEATLDESWKDLVACTVGPSRDCSSKRVFEFRLLEACSCGRFVARTSGSVDCECD